jgi:hypothetical protein
MAKELIVAEVSKVWRGRRDPHAPLHPLELLSGRFEHVIMNNRHRGYRLHSWKLASAVTGVEELTETIVAVFEFEDSAEPAAT